MSILFLWISFMAFSQTQKVYVTHYLFPDFSPGVILMKDGTKMNASLNYNTLSEEMVFDEKGTKLAIANAILPRIDTIYVHDYTFVRIDNKFMGLLHDGGYQLFVQYKCKLTPPGKPAAYGGTSQTSSAQSYSSLQSAGVLYELKLPNDYKTEPYFVYLIRKGNDSKTFNSLRQLRGFYKNREDLFKKYAKENKIDFENPEQVRALISYMEKN